VELQLLGIFGAGLLTLVTPCVLPLIPIYLSLLAADASGGSRGRLSLFLSTLAFSLGTVAVFVALGLTATTLGGLLAEHRTELTLLGGLVIFLFGLKFLGALRVSWLEGEKRLDDSKLRSRFRLLNALVMGLVFGLGWTPCVGPILGSVLTYTASSTADPLRGALYLAVYGAGFTLPLLALALFADGARRVVRRVSAWLPRLEKLSGALMAGAGLYLMLSVTGTPAATLTPTERHAPAVAVSPALGQPSARPRLVQFTSPDCSVCRQMIPTVAVIERDCDGRKVDVVKVDVKANRQLARRYRVRGVPTFVFLDSTGAEVARLVGYQRLPSLRQALSAVVGEQCDGLGLYRPGAEPPAESTCEKPDRRAPLGKTGGQQCGG
jgi:cytochrome c-type biogenesis protein